MQVFDSIKAFQRQHRHCAATIGKYDGMHLGHQRILQRVKAEAAELELPAVVILSEPHPREFFAGEQAPPRLNHFWDKVDFLRDFGLDAVFRLTFDQELSQLGPRDFLNQYLCEGLGVRSLVVGHDFRFGKDRQGGIELLREAGEREGFRVHAEEPVFLDGERISSTLVRQYLKAGDFERVRRLLGRDYSIAGEVVRGRQLGRQLGIPTANVKLETVTLPFTGIYAVRVMFREREFNGVANIGYKPTVTDSRSPSLEVHIFDFDGDLYGGWLKVSFLEKLREEEKFDGLEALKQQMARDLDDARALFRARGMAS